MRLRMRRRKTCFTILKILIICLIFFVVYLYESYKSPTILSVKRLDDRTRVFVVENENDAITIWNDLTGTIDFLSSGTAISISSHFTDGLYIYSPEDAVSDAPDESQTASKISSHISFNDIIDRLSRVKLQSISMILTGFFQTIVWIYPMWLPYNAIFTTKNQHLGTINRGICICTYGNNIASLNDTACDSIFPKYSTSINAEDCQLFDRRWKLMSMQEIYAMISLKEMSLPQPIVVNINLDFFTVEKLKNISINKMSLRIIETGLNKLFCFDSSQKTLIEQLIHKLLEKFVNIYTLMELLNKHSSILCRTQKVFVKRELQLIQMELEKLTDSQLKELSERGICFETVDADKRHRLKICKQFGDVDMATFDGLHAHSCVDTEFHLQMAKVIQILQNIPTRPKIISIIRSSDSGIVSRRNQNFLEKLLLTNLKSIYKLNVSDIAYGNNLVGDPNVQWTHHRQSFYR